MEQAARESTFLAELLGTDPNDLQVPAQTSVRDDEDHDDQTDERAEMLLAWLDAPSYRAERHLLESHLELLDDASEEFLADFIEQYDGQREEQTQLRNQLRVLQDARRRGGDIQAVREANVNAYGGLTLEVPDWVEEVEQRLSALEASGRPDQTATARATLLRTATARAQTDPALPTLTPDELDTLALALRDEERLLADVDRLRADNAALRADNAALREIAEALETQFTATATGTCDPCPWCYADQDYEPHHPDCPVSKARTLLAHTRRDTELDAEPGTGRDA